jgi:hypothetical protein
MDTLIYKTSTIVGRALLIILFSFGGITATSAQSLTLKGYVKSLQSVVFFRVPPLTESIMLNDQLLHNRLNLRYYPSDKWTLVAELRNRAFFGDQVQLDPNFIETLSRGSDDYLDLSAGYRNKKGYALHTALDRLYADFASGNWEFRLGRQRINWGIGTTWNPNDIFNAYNFTDFDYEERPGSDAIRIRRYFGIASSIELAAKAAEDWESFSGAILLKMHSGTYDWQVLAGVAENHSVLGGGWAGNLGDASFKGELAWFLPLEESGESSLALTMGIDYTFENQLYLNGGFLFNSLGSSSQSDATNLFALELSARNLYPYKYSVLTQAMYPITPLLNSGLIVVYSPGESNALFLNPVLTYSIAENWDLDFVLQIFLQKEDIYRSPVQAGFLRTKWSF